MTMSELTGINLAMQTPMHADGSIDADADLRVIRLFLLGGLNWAIEWYREDGPADIDAIAEICCRSLFDGIAG